MSERGKALNKILHWSEVLRHAYGERVQKIALDIGAGCPNRNGLTKGGCIFCDERGGGSGAYLRQMSLEEQIMKGLSGAQKHYKTSSVILYFQSYSATNLPLERFSAALEEAFFLAEKHGANVRAVSVSTRPDLLPQYVLDYLSSKAEETEFWVELGVQTIDQKALEWLRRGHGLAEIEDALQRLRRTRLKICAHLIAGIPNESPEQLKKSALWLAERGVHALKFHPLHVLRGTMLEKLYQDGAFAPIDQDEYTHRVVDALKALPDGIIIQRLNAGARPDRLVAPQWVLDKESMERRIASSFSATVHHA